MTATYEGIVFVCVDRNGSLQADPGMGYVVRLVDADRDGQADEYTLFAALDSPRGAVFDGETLYVSHPPFVTALRDGDGDGIADERRTLVSGLGFGLDFRGADHTTNGVATFGYPALFRNFSDEVVPPIADYGTGSGTGMLFVHDDGLPRPYGDALYSVDWGRNAVFRHALKPRGATFDVDQEEFVAVPRPTDMAIDGRSGLYLASWAGSSDMPARTSATWSASRTNRPGRSRSRICPARLTSG